MGTIRMTKGNISIVKVFSAARYLPIVILKLCLMIWTYDVIGSATSTELTAKICKNAVNSSVESICCHPILEQDKHLETCYEQVNMSVPNVKKDDEGGIIRLSRFTECVYKERKYIKSGNQLNIGRVKAEANRLYHNDSLRKNFMINMYRYCARYATTEMEAVDEDPEVKEVISRSHKPYFMYHFMCLTRYSKIQCPYFIWGNKKHAEDKRCIDFAAECVKGNIE